MEPTRMPLAHQVRPVVRWLAVTAVILLTPLACLAVWDAVEVNGLQRDIASLRSASSLETGQQPVLAAPADDAGRLYVAASILTLGIPEISTVRPLVERMNDHPLNSTERQDALATLEGLLSNQQEALALANRAQSTTFEGFLAGTDFSYRTAGIVSLGRLLQARSISLALSNKGDEAIVSLRAHQALNRALRSTMWTAQFDESIPIVLALSRPTAKSLLELQDLVGQQADPDWTYQYLSRERARHLDRSWSRYYGGGSSATPFLTPSRLPIAAQLSRPFVTNRLRSELREWERVIQVAKQPYTQQWAHASAIKAERGNAVGRPSNAGIPQTLFLSSVERDPLIMWRSAQVAIAIERYRRDHDDQLPASLAELAPSYLSAVPLDPFTDSPLRLIRDASSYAVYSVGPDSRDNQGKFRERKPQTPGDFDMGVRVFLNSTTGKSH